MSFTVSAYQNEYLPDGATEVHAIVTVTAGTGVAAASADTEKVVVLIVDTSGSMTEPGSKIRSASALKNASGMLVESADIQRIPRAGSAAPSTESQ